jgi:periplasmic protein TonB
MEARRAQIQGTVVVHAIVTATGGAENISVIRGLGLGLDKKAIEAVKKWRFKPAHDANDRPVAVSVPIEVSFRLP